MVDFDKLLQKERARKRGQDRSILERPKYAREAQPTPRPSSTSLRMSLGPDEAFAKLAQQLIEAADKVECDVDTYQTGLRYILGEVEIALQASKETSVVD